MSRMSYEQRMFIQDSNEKKRIARSARHTRTHCGKGGTVKFPSDYLTAKERKAMNGKCEEYHLNEPMSWKQFKALPDDLKVEYIKTLRQKFNIPDSYVADMLGCGKSTLCALFDKLGLAKGAGHGARNWDKEAFNIWFGKVIETDAVLTKDDIEKIMVKDDAAAILEDKVPEPDYTYKTLVPDTGEMVFEGHIDDILRTLSMLLSDSKVHISVKWDVVENRDAVDPATQKANLQRSVATATYALMNEERKARLGTKG